MGAGGVGGYFGARLQQAGHEVVFFARGRHLEALRSEGLKLKSPLGDLHLQVDAMDDPGKSRPVDVVLFAVKLWDTESAAERLRPIVGPQTVVIPFQNGVESIERLGKILGPEHVMGGAAYIATRIAAPGVIEQTGSMLRLLFGPVLTAQKAMAEELFHVFKTSNIQAELSDDVVRAVWEKFVFLVGVSGATALSRAPIGVVRADPDLRWLLEAAMRETWSLGVARGVALADDYVAGRMAYVETMHPEMRASLLHDLEAGNRLEAPWLCGAVARMSEQAGLAAPVNRAIFAALTPYVAGRRPAQRSST